MCRAAEAQPFVGYRTGHCTGGQGGALALATSLRASQIDPSAWRGDRLILGCSTRAFPGDTSQEQGLVSGSIKLRVIAASRSGAAAQSHRHTTPTPLLSLVAWALGDNGHILRLRLARVGWSYLEDWDSTLTI
ncbi:hypothetical protein THARTR1_00446 [Trichoderma harzianum]|uniref:Uncharacterized protein n=1 Tax=Trichoderma harzianum TaxID=5544 RepID=A0A2K0URL7_TRIHA|nr:hypothetical protein THARTR1_00446 [Trichoderma harzianum]